MHYPTMEFLAGVCFPADSFNIEDASEDSSSSNNSHCYQSQSTGRLRTGDK